MKVKEQKKKRKKAKPGIRRCRYCGGTVSIRHSSEISTALQDSFLYVCNHYPECSAYVRIRPGTNIPDGEMADAHVRSKRSEAHYYFDMLFKKGLMSRYDAYIWLMQQLCVPRTMAHIKYLSSYDCDFVIEQSLFELRSHGIQIPNKSKSKGVERNEGKAS